MKELFLTFAIILVLADPHTLCGTTADSSSSEPSDTISAEDEAFSGWWSVKEKHLNFNLYENLKHLIDSLEIPFQDSLRSVKSSSFTVGEKFLYRIHYGILSAGIAVIEVPEIVEVNGTQCYRIVSKALSNSFISTFYPVRDIVVSYMAVNGLYPLMFEKHLKEGGYRANYWTIYDQKNSTAYWADTTFEIAQHSHDILSSLFFVRTLDIQPDKEMFVDAHTDKKNYPMKVKFYKRETVKVPAGRFDCVKVEPVLRTPGLFKQKGRMFVWLTDDETHMPVRVKTKISIGSITASLMKYRKPHIAD